MWRIVHLTSWLFCLSILGAQENESPEALLDALLPNARKIEEFDRLVDDLGADGFKVRKEAMDRLLEAPLIPDRVLQRGLESEEPEIRARVREVIKQGGIARSEAVFRRALELLAAGEEKGLLNKVAAVLEGGLTVNGALAARVGSKISLPEDAELLGRLAGAGSTSARRMAAAGAEAIEEAGMGILRDLLEDTEESVRMQAAVGLANLGQIAGARGLAEFLDSESTVARIRAWEGLQALTGRNFGYSPIDRPDIRKAARQKWEEFLKGEFVLKGRVGESRAIALFNGRNLAGWTHYRRGNEVAPNEGTWKVEDGVLRCPGEGPGDLRTNAEFEDYVLVVSYRASQPVADGGIGVMMTPREGQPAVGFRRDGGDYLEVQLLPGRSGDLYKIGGFQAKVEGKELGFAQRRMREVKEPLNEWHEMRLEVRDGLVRVYLNGLLVNEAVGHEKPGRILLREERSKLEFRQVTLLPVGG